MRLLLAATTLLLVASGCSGKPEAVPSQSTSAPAANPPEPKQMYIVATDFSTPASEGFYKFRPQAFSAKVGDVVNITIKNGVGNRDVHNLVLDGYNVKLKGVKDLTASAVFNVTKPGSFKYYCDLMYGPGVSHRQVGFEGTLTVS